MTHFRARLVTACQQILALAVVLVVLTPAASVVTLDVVGSAPVPAATSHGAAGATSATRSASQARMSAYVAASLRPSRVPTAPVKPQVREVQLTSSTATAGRALPTTSARVAPAGRSGGYRLTTTPQRVTGFGEVGVTWAHGVTIPAGRLQVLARTRDSGAWTRWTKVPYDPEHGPNPGTPEARRARPGTEPVLVGKVAQVQVRVTTSSAPPPDMKLAVIGPGHATATATERAAIDTSTMDGNTGADSVYRAAATEAAPVGAGNGDRASLAAAVFTPQPVIYSRAQWGADEKLRDKPSLHYGDIHAGFVHHTVNANNYTRAEVPGIIRSIYAYHVLSRGWSDIGYNFLIDRFGRIWEGRYGGVDRPVVGAHTLGYNNDSFGASAIGNFQIAQPPAALVQAFATLFAWKLSLHGVDAASMHQYVTNGWFPAIQGHRDVYPTECPGKYLYAKIPQIRQLAAAAQRGWSGRQLESNMASTPYPDLVVRRASDGEAFVVPTGGGIRFPAPVTIATGATGATGLVVTPDLTGDGRNDLLVRQADGSLALRAGTPTGGFAPATSVLTAFRGLDQVAAPGDLNGDGRNDLVARDPATGRLLVFLQNADGTFRKVSAGTWWNSFDAIVAAGDLNGDGKPDLLARDTSGKLWLYAGTGTGGFAHSVAVPGRYAAYDVLAGGGDFTRDGIPDLLVRTRSTGQVWVFPGLGNGTFGPRLGPFAGFTGIPMLAVGNVAGNAAPDVVTASGDNVQAWVNPGTYDLGKPIDTGVSFAGANKILKVGDWDRDGYGDVITRTASTGDLVLWRGNGRGRLTQVGVIATGFGSVGKLAAVGDMTGDGYPDLMGQPRGGVMTLWPGKGLAGLRRGYPAAGALPGGGQIGVGRWDGDGAPDSLLRKGGTLTLYHGNGPGGLYAPAKLSVDVSPYDWVIGVSSLTLSGHPDLLVRRAGTGKLYAMDGTGTGVKAPVYLGNGMQIYDLAG